MESGVTIVVSYRVNVIDLFSAHTQKQIVYNMMDHNMSHRTLVKTSKTSLIHYIGCETTHSTSIEWRD